MQTPNFVRSDGTVDRRALFLEAHRQARYYRAAGSAFSYRHWLNKCLAALAGRIPYLRVQVRPELGVQLDERTLAQLQTDGRLDRDRR